MNNARDTIMATLAQAGITNLTVDDVIAEFQASDELAGYLAGADDTEQVILAHLPEYLALRGFAAEVGAAHRYPGRDQRSCHAHRRHHCPGQRHRAGREQ